MISRSMARNIPLIVIVGLIGASIYAILQGVQWKSNIVAANMIMIVTMVLWKSIRTVPQGYGYTVERFGRYLRTFEPGLNFMIPFIDQVGMRVDMRERVEEIPGQEVITKDNASIVVDAVIFYKVVSPQDASYEVVSAHNAVRNLAMTNIRSLVGSMMLDETLSGRENMNTKLLQAMDDATEDWGCKVTRAEIKDITPPEELVQSMSLQMQAERRKRAHILEAEGVKAAAIMEAEGKKEAVTLEAEGDKAAAILAAEARERGAQAEAESTRLVSEAINSGNLNALNYFNAQEYIKALSTIGQADNQKILMLPLDATSLLGSIAGIGEIAKGALNTSTGSRSE